MSADPTPASRGRCERNENLILLILLRLLLATAYLILILTRVIGFLLGTPYVYPVSITAISLTIYWDIVGVVLHQKGLDDFSLNETLCVELFILATSVFSLIYAIEMVLLPKYYITRNKPGHFLLVPIILTTCLFIFNTARGYPRYWRHKRDHRKIKPFLVFAKDGTPMAAVPFLQSSEDIPLSRLSMDSLQQPTEDNL